MRQVTNVVSVLLVVGTLSMAVHEFDPLFPIAGTLIPFWAVAAGTTWALHTK